MVNHLSRVLALPSKCGASHVPCPHRVFGGKRLSRLLLPLLFSTPAVALDANQTANSTKNAVEAPIEHSVVLYKSGYRRDPFLNPQLLKGNSRSNADEKVSLGPRPPGIAGTYIAEALFKGTAVRDDGRIAVVRGVDARCYFLKEGDRLFDGYLKTIDNDSITLVRETKLRSGKTLTQDVIKRLRTP
jgi:hypothetical protein